VRVKDDHTLQSHPLIAVAIGGARFKVRAEQAETVSQLIAERFGPADMAEVRRLHAKILKTALVKVLLPLGITAVFLWMCGLYLAQIATVIQSLAAIGYAALLCSYLFARTGNEPRVELASENEPDWVKDIDWGDEHAASQRFGFLIYNEVNKKL